MRAIRNAVLFLPLALLYTCKPDADDVKPSAGSANFSHFKAVGDNFLSGYQDGALTANGQRHSVAALLARQLAFAGGGSFKQVLLPEGISVGWNSKPWESWYVTALKLQNATDCQGVTSLMPVKQNVTLTDAQSWIGQHTGEAPDDFTIPFGRTDQFFDPAAGANPYSSNANPFFYRIADQPGTSTISGQLSASSSTTFFAMWLGMENIFSWARSGGTGPAMISSTTFATHLDAMLSSLSAQGAKGVIANIPDFRSFPYYTLIPWNGAALTQSKADSLNAIYQVSGLTHIVFHEGANGFVINDTAAPYGVRQMHAGEYITLDVPLDSLKCNFLGLLFSTLPDRYVLDSGEVASIDATIAAYNAVIAQKANQYGLALVDMNHYFASVQSGVQWDGVTYNAQFVTGGFFSLDGYHPHQKGYALITNEFITAINRKFSASVPTLNCPDCTGVLFP